MGPSFTSPVGPTQDPVPFRLVVREVGRGREDVPRAFVQSVVRIGRSRENDLALVNRHMTVSRRHAEIRRVGDRFVLVDLCSKNATRLNGLCLTPLQAYPLRCGDRVEVGDFVLELRLETDPETPSLGGTDQV